MHISIQQTIPKIGNIVVRELPAGQFAQTLCVSFFNAPALLRKPSATNAVGGRGGEQTCIQSATSALRRLMYLTLSLRTFTAWDGWRCAWDRSVRSFVKAFERATHQHSRVVLSR